MAVMVLLVIILSTIVRIRLSLDILEHMQVL